MQSRYRATIVRNLEIVQILKLCGKYIRKVTGKKKLFSAHECSYPNKTCEVTNKYVVYHERSYPNKYGLKWLADQDGPSSLQLYTSQKPLVLQAVKATNTEVRSMLVPSWKTYFNYNDGFNLAEEIQFLKLLCNLVEAKF